MISCQLSLNPKTGPVAAQTNYSDTDGKSRPLPVVCRRFRKSMEQKANVHEAPP
jgi:hypothetical protein